MPLFAGIDLGTSGCRAIAIDSNGNIRAQASKHYSQPQQQTPSDWWQACLDVLQQLGDQIELQQIHAIAVDGTSSTLLLCDTEGQPCSTTLMYNDNRARQQCELIARHAPADAVVHSPSSGLAKLIWLLQQQQTTSTTRLVHQADWIAGMLAGRFDFTDHNNALKTGYDAKQQCWPQWLHELFQQQGWDPRILPTVYQPGTPICRIHVDKARLTGLSTDTMIVAGTTDSTAAVIASGAQQCGDAVTSLGSTLVLKIISPIAVNNSQYGIYSQPYGKHWLVGGASNSGGAVLQHFFDNAQMQQLEKQLHPEQPVGLQYYPLLDKGERFPVNEPQLQGRMEPRPNNDAQFFQALLEGIAEIEHRGYRLLQQQGTDYPQRIFTAGGGSNNVAWKKIRQRILQIPIVNAQQSEAAYGMAKLAAQSCQQQT